MYSIASYRKEWPYHNAGGRGPPCARAGRGAGRLLPALLLPRCQAQPAHDGAGAALGAADERVRSHAVRVLQLFDERLLYACCTMPRVGLDGSTRCVALCILNEAICMRPQRAAHPPHIRPPVPCFETVRRLMPPCAYLETVTPASVRRQVVVRRRDAAAAARRPGGSVRSRPGSSQGGRRSVGRPDV
jgi:hypothetical protein